MDDFREIFASQIKGFEEKIAKRGEYNRKCIELISKVCEAYPELRLGQVLAILNLNVDIFNEEPVDTFTRIKTATDGILKYN